MEESNLVKLIRSLKGNEKRYVVIYLSKHIENNNLLKLFKIISEHPFLAEEQITEKIRDEAILSRLRQSKFDLYNLLLDALHRFDLGKSPYGRILTMLHQSEILLNKGLAEARMELLRKTGQLADEYELPELKLEVVRLRSVGIAETNFMEETKLLTDNIVCRAQLKQVSDQITRFLNKTGERLTVTQKRYLTKSLAAFKKKSMEQNSFYSKYMLSHMLMRCYRYLGKLDESYINGMKVLGLFKQYPKILNIQLWRWYYCYRLHELLLAATRIAENKTAAFVYNEILNMDISAVYKNDAHVNMLDYYIQSGEFKKGEKYLNNIHPYFVKGFQGHNRMVMCINSAVIYFGSGIYSKALFWLNEILNSPKNELAKFPYTGITRLIRLVTYYELKKTELLEYEIRSTSAYIKKHDNSFRMDQLITNYLLKIITVNDKMELKNIMEEALSKLLHLSKIKTEAGTLEFFDFVSWFKSKIENKSFAEVMKRRQINF